MHEDVEGGGSGDATTLGAGGLEVQVALSEPARVCCSAAFAEPSPRAAPPSVRQTSFVLLHNAFLFSGGCDKKIAQIHAVTTLMDMGF